MAARRILDSKETSSADGAVAPCLKLRFSDIYKWVETANLAPTTATLLLSLIAGPTSKCAHPPPIFGHRGDGRTLTQPPIYELGGVACGMVLINLTHWRFQVLTTLVISTMTVISFNGCDRLKLISERALSN